ncbi:hypothetical protein MTR_5g059590 [Medicago truncatula]|uniref:Uncharacterized protein n=1 Tax=Medicago truncatula TaxID=3880 RepID=G7K8Z2_MEDTR|nr:hypothetical protein MTR_5g059590 [Medicago truncatula]
MNIFFWNVRGIGNSDTRVTFREGNVCADRLGNIGHTITRVVWHSTLPPGLGSVFYRDRCGLPNYRFP